MLVLPSNTVPAARQRATTVASYGAMKLDSILDEHVVRAARVVVGRCLTPAKGDSGETVRIPRDTGETLRIPEESPSDQEPGDAPSEDGGEDKKD